MYVFITEVFNIIQDGTELPQLITFEDDESVTKGPSSVQIPMQPKMVVDDQYGDLIGAFLQQFFKVYDSDNREPLAHAYHEQAMMSMSASFIKSIPDETVAKYYIQDSRNLQMDAVQKNPAKRDRLLLQRRTQIVGFLDGLPKTQHDVTSFTLDVTLATEVIVSFTVTGAFRYILIQISTQKLTVFFCKKLLFQRKNRKSSN